MEMYHDELYRLDVSERIQLIVCVHVYKCLHGISRKAINICRPVAVIDGQSLGSTNREQRDVSHLKTSTYGRRAFSFASPSAWNSLPNYLKDWSVISVMFKRSLKTFCFQSISTSSALDMFACLCYINLHLNYCKNGCVRQRLIRLVFVLIGFFESIKQWEQCLKILYIRKKSITCDYIANSDQPHWLVLTIYSIKLLKLNGKCLLFKIESFVV